MTKEQSLALKIASGLFAGAVVLWGLFLFRPDKPVPPTVSVSSIGDVIKSDRTIAVGESPEALARLDELERAKDLLGVMMLNEKNIAGHMGKDVHARVIKRFGGFTQLKVFSGPHLGRYVWVHSSDLASCVPGDPNVEFEELVKRGAQMEAERKSAAFKEIMSTVRNFEIIRARFQDYNNQDQWFVHGVAKGGRSATAFALASAYKVAKGALPRTEGNRRVLLEVTAYDSTEDEKKSRPSGKISVEGIKEVADWHPSFITWPDDE